MAHNTYGLDMRDDLWRARCGCGWQSPPSPDVGAQAAELDGHLRHAVADTGWRPPAMRRTVVPLPLRLLHRTALMGAVVLGVALLEALAAGAGHEADGR